MSEADDDGALIDQHVLEAWRCYLGDRCGDGLRLARAAITLDRSRGDAWYVAACNLERSRRLREADRAFHRAAFAPMNPQVSPFRVGWDRFARSVEQAASLLPERFQTYLQEVDLVLRNHALPEFLADEGGDEILSKHLGPVLAELDASVDHEAAIQIYRRPIEHRATNAREFDDLVRFALIEGLGSFLQLDQDTLDQLLD
jgi:predicted Zn-dependent protease with MMP-like domain